MKRAIILLGISLLALVIVNSFWIHVNTLAPHDDTAGHTVITYIYTNIWNGRFNFPSVRELLQVSTYYPPFLFLVSSVLPLVFGFHFKILQYWSQLLLAGTVIALFFYTYSLTKNSRVSLFSSLSFMLFPHVWEQSRYFMLDIPLTGLTLASLYALYRTENLRKTGWILASFALMSLAQLTKWYAWIYLAIPVLISLWQSKLVQRPFTLNVKAILAGFVLSIALLLPWYGANAQSLLSNASFYTRPDFGDPLNSFSVMNMLYYPMLLINYQIVSFQFLWLIACLIGFIKYGKNLRALPLFQTVFIYFLFTFIGNKNPRFILPLLPYVAIIIGFGTEEIISRYKTKGILPAIAVFLFSVLFLFVTSFSSIDARAALPIGSEGKKLLFLDLSSHDVPYLYRSFRWSQQEIIDEIAKTNKLEPRVLVVSHTNLISVETLRIFSLGSKPLIQFIEVPYDTNRMILPEELDEYLSTFDYILVPDTYVGRYDTGNYQNLNSIREYILGGKTREFVLTDQFILPDKDTLYLLKNNPSGNLLTVEINQEQMKLIRPPSITNIYYQFKLNEGQWIQKYISENETVVTLPLQGIQTVRIDYPSHLMQIQTIDNWTYDGDKQIDRIPEQDK